MKTNALKQIKEFIASQPEPKRSELQQLHQLTLKIQPKCQLWFDNGVNAENKTVANPTMGYGFFVIKYANGSTRDFFRIGISANQTGISVYVLGLKDKNHLSETYGKRIGKAKVTGYCIRFKTLKDINLEVLEEAMRYGLEYEA